MPNTGLVFVNTLKFKITAYILRVAQKVAIISFKRNGLSELKYQVILQDVYPHEAIEYKNQLMASGLVQEQDFVWSYYSAEYDNFSHDAVRNRQTVFRFRDAALASFYQLKWG